MRKRVRKLTRRKTIMTKTKSKGKRGVFIKRKNIMTKTKSKGKGGVFIKRKKSKKFRKKSNKLRKKCTHQNSHMGGSSGHSPGYFGPGDRRKPRVTENMEWGTIPEVEGSDPLHQFLKELEHNTSRGDPMPPTTVFPEGDGAGPHDLGLNLDEIERMLGNTSQGDRGDPIPSPTVFPEGDGAGPHGLGLNLDEIERMLGNTSQGDGSAPPPVTFEAPTVGTDTQARANWNMLRLYTNVHKAMRKALKNNRELKDTEFSGDFSSEELEMMRGALNFAPVGNPSDDEPLAAKHHDPKINQIFNKYLIYADPSLSSDTDHCKYFIEAMINAHKNKNFLTFLVENFADSTDERRINPGITDKVNNFYDFSFMMIMIGIEPKDRPGDFKYQREFNEDIYEWVEPDGEIAYEPWWSSGNGDRDYIIERLTQIYKTHRPDKVKQIDKLMADTKRGYGKYVYLLLTAVILKYERGIDISQQIGEVFPKDFFARLFS